MLQTIRKPIISLETVTTIMIASSTENKVDLFGLVAPSSQPGPNREHTKQGVAFS